MGLADPDSPTYGRNVLDVGPIRRTNGSRAEGPLVRGDMIGVVVVSA